MKKRLVLMAMAGVALAGCVNDEVAEISQKQEQAKAAKVVFESPVMYDNGNDSRASVFGEIGEHPYGTQPVKIYSYPREENIKIFAVQYTGSFPGWQGTGVAAADFNNTSMSFDGNVDGWAPKNGSGDYYHWPVGKNMAFSAYSPAELTVVDTNKTDGDESQYEDDGQTLVNATVAPVYDTNGLTITNFKVMPNAAKQYDLLFSKRIVDIDAEDIDHGASYYSGVPITFQHALSSIRFSLQNTSSSTVKIQSIKLYGVYDTGDFTENITETGHLYDYIRGDGGNVAPNWTTTGNIIPEGKAYQVFEGDVTAPLEAQYLSNLLDTSVPEYSSNTGTFHQLLMIPQSITNNVKVYIKYTINGADASKTVFLKDALKVNPTNKNEVLNETLGAWQMGTRYTYRLWYSEESASKDRIYFSPSTDGWKDAGAYRIEL